MASEKLRTQSLEMQLGEARAVNAEKDRKIRELNALLLETRKNAVSTATTNNSSDPKDEMMSFTSGDLSVLRHIPLNSGEN